MIHITYNLKLPESYNHDEIEHVPCMNIPDAVPGSVVKMTDSVPPVRVSIALMHTVTTPSVSFTV